MSHNEKPKRKDFKVRETLSEVTQQCTTLKENFRGIPAAAYAWAGVKAAYSKEDGKTIEKLYFPTTADGKLVGYQCKDLMLSKKEDFHFYSVGKNTTSCEMYLQEKCKGNKQLIIVEGFLDALAVRFSIKKTAKKHGWSLIPDVVSITHGTTNAVESIGNNMSFVERYEEVFLMFDGDSASDYPGKKGIWGKEATENVYKLLGSNTKVIQLPHLKDPCDVLNEQGWEKLGWLCKKAKKFCPDEIVLGADTLLDEIMTPLAKGVFVATFPKLMNKMKGFRLAELTVYTAPSGFGKSSIVAEIAYSLVQSGKKIGMIFLEESVVKTKQRFVAMKLGVPLPVFRQDPTQFSKEEIQEAIDEMIKDKVDYVSHFGSINSERLINKIRYMKEALGCQHIILDHLSMVISGQESNNERKDIDMLMTSLATICTELGVALHVVVHMKRKNFTPPMDKEGEIIYPYWIPVSLDDLRGCVDKDTEYLSPCGWKPIAHYDEGKVAQYDKEGNLSFVQPQAFIKKPCEEMVHITTNKGLDMMLSDEHRIAYVTEKKPKDIKFITVAAALEEHETNVTGFRGRIPTTFKKKGGKPFDISPSQLRIQVAVNADGWIRNNKTGLCSIRLKKKRKIDRLCSLLKESEMEHTTFYLSDERVEFSFHAPLGYKGVNSDWYNLDQHSLEIIADELKYWDGELSTGRFSSINKRDADFAQFAYGACGYRSAISKESRITSMLPANDGSGGLKTYNCQDIYKVGKAKNSFVSFRKCPNQKHEIRRVKTLDGMKYCFTVDSGMFLARRNGKIFVTGNSAGLEQMSWNVIGIEPEMLEDGRGRVRLRVLKNREWSYLGLADIVQMNERTGRIESAEEVRYGS